MAANTTTCRGLLLPVVYEDSWHGGVRGLLYMLFMLWTFFGVAIVADAFMCGIEHITSKTRKIQIPDPVKKDALKNIEVKVWNDTVANLSLLAFGTSAPEIMLSVIETIGNGFESGELGPGTIVGSAAFNLFIITAICILSIPAGEGRRLKNMRVFSVTTFTGIFAYIWLIIVLAASSPEVIDLWEAVVTFLMFPALILVAYTADRGFFCSKNKTASEVEIAFDIESGNIRGSADIINMAREFQREARLSEDETAKLVAARIAGEAPKPTGWYRVSATRNLTGGHRLIPQVNTFDKMFEKRRQQTNAESVRKMSMGVPDPDLFLDKAIVEFTCTSCAVLESEGSVRLGIRRYGNMEKEVKIGVETIDGTAEAGEDYKPIKQLVTFKPNESLKDIYIEIKDDDVWEPDEFFYVKLFHNLEGSSENDVVIGKISINQVTIVNDDEPGKLEFSKPSYIVKESAGHAQLTLNRVNGADGEVSVSWRTKDLSAKAGQEYVGGGGRVSFLHGETSKVISIGILGIQPLPYEIHLRPFPGFFTPDCYTVATLLSQPGQGKAAGDLCTAQLPGHKAPYRSLVLASTGGPQYENAGRNAAVAALRKGHSEGADHEPNFQVELSAPLGGAEIGKIPRTIVTIINDEEFSSMVTRIAQKTQKNLEGLRLDKGSWGEQFYAAMNVNGGDLETATTLDHVLHFLTFFWKVLFAFIPPPSVAGGWLTFGFALLWIGLLTAIISDIATIFGCVVGLSDTITAITFVAMGTSMPDTFASRTAAMQEKWADSAIGNVNGSNAVNVFLGLGLPWLISAIYWKAKGGVLRVASGSLGFSVALFTPLAVLTILLLMLRRHLSFFGKAELGGRAGPKVASALLVSVFWVLYLLLASLQAQGLIHVGF